MHHGTSARGSSYYDWRRMTYYAYIMASRKNGTLYVGVKIDVIRRAFEHREGTIDGFTERYDIKSLVYFEEFDDPRTAIQREKNIKQWGREWQLALIEKENPDWQDLFDTLTK